jgi:hypothetical protein
MIVIINLLHSLIHFIITRKILVASENLFTLTPLTVHPDTVTAAIFLHEVRDVSAKQIHPSGLLPARYCTTIDTDTVVECEIFSFILTSLKLLSFLMT